MTPAATPEVSVVVRSYNRGERLLRAIDSVLAQTFDDYELLVVDDGSDDGSADAVTRRYAAEPRLRLIALNVNQGAAAAANVGVGEARGRYVAFLDSDDEWLPAFLEMHVAALRLRPGAVLSYCDYVRVFDEYDLEQPIRSWPGGHARREFLQGGFIHSMSLTVTLRDAIIAAGGFDDDYTVSHDFDLWLRLALAVRAPFEHVAAPLVRHRISLDGVTSHSQRWLEEYQDALARGFRHPAAAPFAEEQAEARRRIALGIVARRQLARWVREPAQRSVSVVLLAPVGTAGLPRALDSVLAQVGVEMEIIVVCDDLAQVDALEQIEGRDDPCIRIARFNTPQSCGRLLNAGLRAATGELVAFLDADDRWHEGYLQAQLRAQSVILPAPALTVSEWTVHGEPVAGAGARWPERTSDLMASAITGAFPGPLSAAVVPRARLGQIDGANEELAVGVGRELLLRVLGAEDDEGRAAVVRSSPVGIARALVDCGGSADRLGNRRELAQVYASDVFRSFWSTPAGREYVFLRNEAIAQFMRRGF